MLVFQTLVSDGYTKNIISATNSERAGGYLENIGCLRAVQEAMMGLYFTPIVEHVVGKSKFLLEYFSEEIENFFLAILKE